MRSDAYKHVIEVRMKAVKDIMDTRMRNIVNIKSPEAEIGKPFEEWTPFDMAMAEKLYKGDKRYADFLVKKKLEQVQKLEEGLP